MACWTFVPCRSSLLLGIIDAALFLCCDKELFELFERKPDVFKAFASEVDELAISGRFFVMFTAALLVFRFGYISSVKGQMMFPHINFSEGVDVCGSPDSVAFSNPELVA